MYFHTQLHMANYNGSLAISSKLNNTYNLLELPFCFTFLKNITSTPSHMFSNDLLLHSISRAYTEELQLKMIP
jgi:hypothetical protein